MKREGLDTCPKCKEQGLPKVPEGSLANAVMCQKCGFVKELKSE